MFYYNGNFTIYRTIFPLNKIKTFDIIKVIVLKELAQI